MGEPIKSLSLYDESKHACYKCLTKACCSRWCSDFYGWVEKLQEKYGNIDRDVMVNYVIRYSRKENWANEWTIKC